MIAKGTPHNNGVKLAAYMTTGKDHEIAALWQLRGFAADNIKDAFRSVHAMAAATKCSQPFLHVQVRNREGEFLTRDQWEQTADAIEAKLGLQGQPRAIAFHMDGEGGHEHMHVAWSRIDEETMTARPLPFFKLRLKEVSRALEKEFDLAPVSSERATKVMAARRSEEEQARRLNVDVRVVRQTIRDCFAQTDSGQAFAAALADHGLTLAQGDRRSFVVLDAAGGIYALGKRLLGVTAAETRERLADLNLLAVPTVEEVRAHLSTSGRQERQQRENQLAPSYTNTPGQIARLLHALERLRVAPPVPGQEPTVAAERDYAYYQPLDDDEQQEHGLRR